MNALFFASNAANAMNILDALSDFHQATPKTEEKIFLN